MIETESPIEGEILTPETVITVTSATESYGRFVIEPLLRGFGVTLGNALRRVLLNSLPGMAVTAARIEGTHHEYSTLPHVREDMIDFLLNVKGIRIRSLSGRSGTLRLEIGGRAGAVTAADIQRNGDYEVVNPEMELLHMDSKDAQLSVEFQVEQGTGFRAATGQVDGPIGLLPVDAIFTPIRRANFEVEATRVGQVTDFDRLILEVWTDNTITPQEAVQQSSRIIMDHLAPLAALRGRATDDDPTGTALDVPESLAATPLEDLQLSSRTQNSLRRGNLATVGDVLERTGDELLALRNFGDRSLSELAEKLRERGVPVPETGGDRAWRKTRLALLMQTAEEQDGATAETETAAPQPEPPAVYSTGGDEDETGEVDLTHFSRRSFSPDEDED